MHINIARYEIFQLVGLLSTALAFAQLCPLHDSRTYSAMKITCISLEKPFFFPFFLFSFAEIIYRMAIKN